MDAATVCKPTPNPNTINLIRFFPSFFLSFLFFFFFFWIFVLTLISLLNKFHIVIHKFLSDQMVNSRKQEIKSSSFRFVFFFQSSIKLIYFLSFFLPLFFSLFSFFFFFSPSDGGGGDRRVQISRLSKCTNLRWLLIFLSVGIYNVCWCGWLDG